MSQLKAKGFTLIELMVVIAIIAILAAIAAPSFTSQIRNARLKTATEEFNSDLIFARNEAIRRNAAVFFNMQVKVDGTWCYALGSTTGTAVCDCATTPSTICDIRMVTVDKARAISTKYVAASDSLFDKNFRLEARNGFPRDADGSKWTAPTRKTLVLTNSDGKELYTTISSNGRTKTCTGTGSAALGSYNSITTITSSSDTGNCL